MRNVKKALIDITDILEGWPVAPPSDLLESNRQAIAWLEIDENDATINYAQDRMKISNGFLLTSIKKTIKRDAEENFPESLSDSEFGKYLDVYKNVTDEETCNSELQEVVDRKSLKVKRVNVDERPKGAADVAAALGCTDLAKELTVERPKAVVPSFVRTSGKTLRLRDNNNTRNVANKVLESFKQKYLLAKNEYMVVSSLISACSDKIDSGELNLEYFEDIVTREDLDKLFEGRKF